MHKRMLRSVLVAACSAVMAVSALAGLSGAKGHVNRADSTWGVVAPKGAKSVTAASASSERPDDSTWG
ncbi:hypothetical protein GCM10023336_30620 [Streptomyces similanensis]|uniref:Uncharacterized protein n=1 Tax=Streptomyces similanensis TaxID=1274988 RepID=A0ABP9KH55_9ACTN